MSQFFVNLGRSQPPQSNGVRSCKYELCAFSTVVSFGNKNKQTAEKLVTQVPSISGESLYANTSHLYYKMSRDPTMLQDMVIFAGLKKPVPEIKHLRSYVSFSRSLKTCEFLIQFIK